MSVALRARPGFWCWAAVWFALVVPARADMEDTYKPRPPAVTPVYQQPRPSYDSPKIALGSFLLAPSFSEILAGDDNIFANDRHQVSDLVVTTGEDLNIQSQWRAGSATLHAYQSHQWYSGHATENGKI